MSGQTTDYELGFHELRHILLEHGPSMAFRQACDDVEARLTYLYPEAEPDIIEMIIAWRVHLGELSDDVGMRYI